jgi:pyruvate dehydrogenase E2 component (dihydrolipoamide acetyltransferase)
MSDVTMPQLGETVTEGTITRWAKAVGEKVDQDEVLFEVSTDKVDSEVPSPAAGYLSEILVPEGETVDVGTRLAVISDQPGAAGSGNGASAEPEPSAASAGAEPAEAQSALAEAQGPAEPAAVPSAPPQSAPPQSAAPQSAAPQSAPTESEPAQAQAAAESASQSAPVEEVGPPTAAPSGREGEADGVDPAAGDRVLSPVVRRLLSEHQLDPASIRGTGVGGRTTRNDVLDAVDRQGGSGAAPGTAEAQAAAVPAASQPTAPPAQTRAAPAPAAAGTAAPSAPRPVGVTAEGDDEVVPFTNIRRRTAEHMVRSKATSAHTFTATEVDFHAVDVARQQVQESFRASEGFGVSYLPFIARAVIDSIGDYPRVNSSVGDDQLIIHRRVHLGVAVDLDLEGLIVPVVKDADSKRLRAIAREIRDLAERARSRRLSADEIAGGTFTITNPGPFGTLMTVPIINQPQVAILSTDGIKRKPVVAELTGGGEGIVIHPVGLLGLSYDHRAIDGAYASAFLARCREYLETRDWVQEL